MTLFYSEREMGVAYSWVNAGTALSQVTFRLWNLH